jgi:subtilisin
VTDPRAGQNQTVAVIDCGIDYSYDGTYYQYHEDLNDSMFRDWLDRGGVGFRYNWLTDHVDVVADHRDDEPPGYKTGHGTHVSGTIAAVDNDVGVIGTAPKALLYMLKLCTLNVKEVVAAINYVVDNLPANVISMSFSFNGSWPRSDFADLENACQRAYNSGRLLFAASGNDNRSVIDYPAKYDSVVAVGAVFQRLKAKNNSERLKR